MNELDEQVEELHENGLSADLNERVVQAFKDAQILKGVLSVDGVQPVQSEAVTAVVASEGNIFVCLACGKTSTTNLGDGDPAWDDSCKRNCHEMPIKQLIWSPDKARVIGANGCIVPTAIVKDPLALPDPDDLLGQVMHLQTKVAQLEDEKHDLRMELDDLQQSYEALLNKDDRD